MPGLELLSDAKCRSARPKASLYYLTDGGGLRLQVRPNGSRYWMFRYMLGGKESTYLIGNYPEVSLAAARRAREDVRRLLAQGKSPTVARRLDKAKVTRAEKSTFAAVAIEWMAHSKAEWSDSHYERNKGLLDRLLIPDLGSLPIASIDEPMLLRTLRAHYDAGTKESARRARAIAGQIFTFAKGAHLVTSNPARELADNPYLKKPDVKHFAALSDEQVGPMLQALNASQRDPVTKGAIALMLLTGLRDASLRGAKWKEIDLELATWTIPADRMKRREQHSVPLPRQAVVTLQGLRTITFRGPDSHVFASHGKAGYLAENTLRLVLHGLGFPVTAHGIRSLLTDVLNKSQFNQDAIERQLHHADKDKVRAAYLRTDFFDYRRTMMQWFADWCEAQLKDQAAPPMPDNVVQIRRTA